MCLIIYVSALVRVRECLFGDEVCGLKMRSCVGQRKDVLLSRRVRVCEHRFVRNSGDCVRECANTCHTCALTYVSV
jgi:hypothetical protein